MNLAEHCVGGLQINHAAPAEKRLAPSVGELGQLPDEPIDFGELVLHEIGHMCGWPKSHQPDPGFMDLE